MAKTQYANLAEEAFATAFTDQYEGVTDGIEADTSIPTPVTFGEKLEAGFDAGRAGLSAGAQSFFAIGNALVGDEKGVADRLNESKFYNQEAGNALSQLESFQEFYDNPTWDGFATQFATGLGQAAPSAVATVAAALATGGTSILGQALGKGALSVGSKVAMKRVMKEAADNAADGVASKAEKELVGQVYKTFKKGAYAGAAGTSFVPLAGQNFDEGIEAGRAPDADLAMRSLLVAAPQAALDVAVEAALLKSFTKVVKERGGKALKSGSMAALLKEIGKAQAVGTVSEAAAEGGQEAISVVNRAQMDPNFSASSEEAFMRIAQNAFLGGVGGYGMGSVGGTFTGSAKTIFAKADKLATQAREQRAEQEQEGEEYGDLNTGNTTQESMADINAQLSAMFDPTSTKKAVWAAGDISDSFRQNIPTDNTTTAIEINGNKTYAAHIPERGVIVGDKATVDAVVAEGATDLSLQQALGYSQNKQEGARTNIVVQAINRDGQIVSEEVTDKEGLGMAWDAAEGLAGSGGKVKKVSLSKALRARKQRLDREKGPTVTTQEDGLDKVREELGAQYDIDYGPEVRDMDASGGGKRQSTRQVFRDKVLAGLKNVLAKNPDDTRISNLAKRFEEGTVEQQDEIIRTIFDTDPSAQGVTAKSEPAAVEEVSTATFKNDPKKIYKNTLSAREAYVAAFGQVNWNDPFYSRMTESFLEKAAALKAEDPSVYVDADRDSKGEVYQYKLFKQESETATADFLDPADIDKVLDKAQSSQYSDGGAFLITPDQAPSPVNLVNLAVEGTKILRDRGETNWDTPAANYKAGLIEFLKQLSNAQPDYQIQIGRSLTTYSLADVLSGEVQIDERAGNTTAARIDGKDITLFDLIEADSDSALPTNKQKYKVSGTRTVKQPSAKSKTTDAKVNNNIDTSTTQINSRSEPTPQSDTAQNSSESLARRKSVEAMNRSQQQSTEQAAKSEFTNEQEVTEYYNTAEQADARAEVLRSKYGFDVTVTDPVTKEETGIDRKPIEVPIDDGREKQGTPDDGPNDAPSTYLNLEGGKSTKGRGGKATPNTKPKFIPVQYPAGAVNKLVTQIADAMNKVIKLKNSVVVMGVKQLKTMTDAQIKGMFDDPRVGDLIVRQLKDLSRKDSKLGKYIEFGDTHVILVDNTKGNELQAALTVAHEMGHALFNEELDGSLERGPTRDRLQKAFMRAQRKKGAPAAYQGNNPYAFEEWYADQVAIWAKSFLNKPLTSKGLVDSHFKKVAAKLQKMWKALDRVIRQRFGAKSKSQTFDAYINAVVKTRKNTSRAPGVSARKTAWQKKAIVREMEKAVEDAGARDPILRLLRGFSKLLDNPKGRMLKKIFLPEDNILRKISPVIADMFYVQSNSGSGLLGFLNSKTNRSNAILNDLEDILGAKWDTKEVQDALAEAADDSIDTAELTGKAKLVRQYLESLYDNYIALTPGNQIAKAKNYFPVSLALAEIYNDQEAFISLVKKYNPDMTDTAVRGVVHELVRKREYIVDNGDISFDATNPQKVVEKARVLTKNIPPKELKKFLEKPEVALIRYVRHVTIRSEFLRSTRDKDGKDLLAEAMADLSPDEKERATHIIERYLGYTTKPLNPAVQKINSYLQLFNWITLLPLATIGSIPECGGAIVNTREFNGFEMALKAITKTVKDRAQAKQLARSLGVSVSTAMGNLGLTDADAEFLDPKVRKLSDGFFKVIGLDFFTRFTREFGAAMGIEFLVTHAADTANNPRAPRYLKELNVTAEQITAWHARQQEGKPYTFDGADGQAVKAAITRFVESSMLRPNAAERPSWGNDPMWTLVWALKSFLYSFGKVIIGGVKREMQVRSQEGATNFDKIGGVAMMGGLMAAAFLPLAMVGLELREIAKAGIAGVLPGVDANARYFRSDRMDYGEYLGEMFERAGFYGPMAIFSGAFDQVGWGKSGLGSLFGPTAGLLIDDIGLGLIEGKRWEILPERIIPGYNLVL
jgi:ribosomal protein L14